MVEFEDAVSERMAQLEQEDLERYQRDLDLQRRIVRMRRPIQRFEMRVPDYYRRFCYWKEEMISVGYPEDESIYIDDFIGNLQLQIQLRVLNRRLRISRLVDAYYEAKFEETTILLEMLMKDLKAANDIHEMGSQTTIEIQRDDDIGISMEEESIDNIQQDELYAHQMFDDMPRSLSIELKEEDGGSDGDGGCDEQYPVVEIQSNDSAIKSAEDAVQIDADKVVVKMTEPVLEENLLGIESTEDAYNMLDERPVLPPVDLDENFIQDVSYADDILEFSVANSQSLSKLGFNPQVFDPGTFSIFKQKVYECQLNEIEGQLHCASLIFFQVLCSLKSLVPRNEYIGKDARSLFDNMSKQYSSRHKVGVERLGQPSSGNWKPHLINFTISLCSKDADTNVFSDISSSKVMFRETVVLTFNPGIGSLHLTGCAPLNSNEMPHSSVVALWFAKILFCFNTYGCWLFYNDCDHSLTPDVQIHVFIGEKVLFAVKMIIFCILFSGGWAYRLDLASNYGIWPCCLFSLKANFAWDGIYAFFVYILEDKDVFERVGKWIIYMDYITYSTVTMLMLMNHDEDHFGAISLQQAGDTEQSLLLSFSLQTLYLRYGILIGIHLIGIASHCEDNLVQELGCNVDKNACIKLVFRHLLVNTLDLHSLMIHIFNDGVLSVNFKWSYHHLFALPLFQEYNVRKLKKTGVVMRILLMRYLQPSKLMQYQNRYLDHFMLLLMDMESQRHENINVAGIAFGILEYSVDATMIFMLALLAGFVWDPGQDVVGFYIVDDNDVLKRKSIWIQMAFALKHDEKLNGASAYFYAYTWPLACSLVDWKILLLPITSSKLRIRKSHNLIKLLATYRSVGIDCEVNIDAMRFKRLNADSELNSVVQSLINKHIEPSPQLVLAIFTIGLEHYIWDPGSSAALVGGPRVDAYGSRFDALCNICVGEGISCCN